MSTRFELTNYTFSMLSLMTWALFIAVQRVSKPLEWNPPLLYWLVLVGASMKWPDDTWKLQYVAAGLIFCLVLRFEFMNHAFITVFRVCEMCVFGYVLFYGIQLVFG